MPVDPTMGNNIATVYIAPASTGALVGEVTLALIKVNLTINMLCAVWREGEWMRALAKVTLVNNETMPFIVGGITSFDTEFEFQEHRLSSLECPLSTIGLRVQS